MSRSGSGFRLEFRYSGIMGKFVCFLTCEVGIKTGPSLGLRKQNYLL